jgi:hypothetical protein
VLLPAAVLLGKTDAGSSAVVRTHSGVPSRKEVLDEVGRFPTRSCSNFSKSGFQGMAPL